MTTLKDIAEATGFSITTVSRVLNNSAGKVGISEETQQKIWRMAKELNYRPNKIARNLKLGREPRAVLFLYGGAPHLDNEKFLTHPFFSHMLHGIHLELTRTGHYLAYMDTSERNLPQLKSILEEAVSGVISFRQLRGEVLRVLRRKSVPVVSIEPYAPELDAYAVYVDNQLAVRQGLEHLYELGHRRICLICLRHNCKLSGPMLDRWNAFRSEVARLGKEVEGIIEFADMTDGVNDIEASCKAAYRVFASDEPPTAILTTNDLCAVGVLEAARSKNVKVPEDLSVVGIDNIDWAAHTVPPLTTVEIPKEEMGVQAVALLDKLLKGERFEPHTIKVQTKLVIRESTAPVRTTCKDVGT